MKYNEIVTILPGKICVVKTKNGKVCKYVRTQPNKIVKFFNKLIGKNKVIVYEARKTHSN